LYVHRGRLMAHDPGAQAALERRGADAAPVALLSAARVGAVAPYALMVVQVRPDVGAWLEGEQGASVVFIVDPEADAPAPGALWRAAFGLTFAESEVAELLVQGLSQREIAEARQVGINTVHSQIKRIYEKLESTSQAQAAARLVRGAPFAAD
jgi:DNA-binding CsgD family transcriptional regulator